MCTSDFSIKMKQAETLKELLDILNQYTGNITDEPISLTQDEEKILDDYYRKRLEG
ncbi:MAG: hypothetical protein HYV97_18730 [Bdellovibrio sp.]|nr:hypothetical protein [Bdellovibrio sp.]